jgi:outer membrane lipoprotein-sorting protein
LTEPATRTRVVSQYIIGVPTRCKEYRLKKVVICLVALVCVLTAGSLVACSKAAKTTSNETTATKTSPAAKPTTTTSSSSSGATINDILGKLAGVASVKYDMVTTVGTTVVNGTMWVKKNKVRFETSQGGQSTVMLINGDTQTAYMYTPSQNSAMKIDLGQAPKSASDYANSITKNNPTTVGTETLDGKLCLVIQWVDAGTTTKAWMWEEKGLPVRVQTTSSQGTSTTDFKNFDFSAIADSQFDLPAGVQIISLPTGLPTGLPTNLPTGLPSGLPTNLPTGLPTNLPTR